ncbi:MAG: c-type cytochrome biogenesis protein CcsB [Candidatus Krumholzibacteriota bacterium]|nr:c-type cytochrome biogenesis protein CcsB [Candidatus Krumholzibacteriota bacterium]
MLQQVDIGFFWGSFWFYISSFILFSIYAGSKKESAGKAGLVIFSIALILQTAGLVARWTVSSHPPLATMFEYSLTMSWIIAIWAIVMIFRYRMLILGVIVSPVLVMVLVIASMLPKNASALMPALQSYWFYIHVTLAAASEGAFLVSSGAALILLLRKGGKNEKESLVSTGFLDELISGAIRIGYPVFTIGALFAGAIWANYAWGRFWSWDPKETGALVIWLFYTLVLHQNVRGRWKGRMMAKMSIVGLGIIMLSFLGNLFLGGLHSYI